MKHLLKLEDWSAEEITRTLNLADQLKYEQKHGIEHKLLKGKTLGMIFEKSSAQTTCRSAGASLLRTPPACSRASSTLL